MYLLTKTAQLLRGQSYWSVKLTTGKEFSELDQAVKFVPDPITGKLVARQRAIEWLEDIVGSGDNAHIKELHLVTPQGDACLTISEPYTAFQLKRGTMLPFSGERIANAHVIGRVDDKTTGACTAAIWDVQEQKLYINHSTTVFHFTSWREGAADVGSLSLEVQDIRLSLKG